MASSTAARKSLPLIPTIMAACCAIILVGGLIYLSRPAPRPSEAPPSAEAQAYVSHLKLSDVNMKASENFAQQQVVEIDGKIANQGSQTLKSIEIYCIFYGANGQEVYRERVPVIPARVAFLKPGEVRPFRLAFDNLPDEWNQVMPKMVIAQIVFA